MLSGYSKFSLILKISTDFSPSVSLWQPNLDMMWLNLVSFLCLIGFGWLFDNSMVSDVDGYE